MIKGIMMRVKNQEEIHYVELHLMQCISFIPKRL